MKYLEKTIRRSKPIFAIATAVFVLTFSSSVWATPYGELKMSSPRQLAASESDLNFTIKNLSPYVVQNSNLKLSIETQVQDSTFRIEVFKPTNTQSEFFKFAADLGNRRISDSIEIPLSSFTKDINLEGRYEIEIPVNSEPETSLNLGGPGVYPIAISQQKLGNKGTKTQYSFTTNVPNVGTNGAAYSQKLKTVPLFKYSPTIDATKLLDDKRLLTTYGKKIQEKVVIAQKAADAISKFDAPKTILLNPESFEIYSYLKSSNSSNLQSANLFTPNLSEFNEYVADSYVPVSITELEKQRTTGAYSDLATVGRTIINKAGFLAPSRTLITKNISKSTLEIIAKTGIDQVVVEDTNFSPETRPATKPAILKQGNLTLGVGTSDTKIAKSLPDSLSNAAKANYLIAATSVLTLEKPSVKRGFILPLDLDKFSEETLALFLNAAKSSPYIEPISTDSFFRELEENKDLSKKLIKATFPTSVSKSISLKEHQEIDSYTSAVDSCFSSSSEFSRLASWMRLSSYSRSDRKVSEFISVEKAKDLSTQVSKLIELPKERTLTITSRENEIPVTIRNNYDKPIDIVVKIEGDKLSFPKGQRFPLTLKQENTTVRVPVKARTSGSFRISIEVITPKESVLIGKQNATVRSTVVSGAGVGIATAALVFLAVWWATHAHRSRKKPIAPVIEISHENAV